MNNAPTGNTPSQTVEGQDVGDVIRGRFPEQLPQDTDQQTSADVARAAGRIDVRDFSQMLSGLAVPEQAAAPADAPAATVVPPAFSAPAATSTAPAAAAVVVAEPEPEPELEETAEPGRRLVDWSHVWQLAVADVRGTGTWTVAKWKAETIRRTELRDEVRPHLEEAKREHAKARRIDPKSGKTRRARKELRRLRRAYPATMWQLTAGTTAAAGVLGLAAVEAMPPAGWAWSGVGALGAFGLYTLVLIVRTKLRPREVADPNALVPTEEEQHLLDRLQPEYWKEHAEERGLDGTLTGRPELTPAGIVAAVRLDGKWTADALRKAEENIRALLGIATDTRMEIARGSKGGWARVNLRTRSATDGMSLTWVPGYDGIGIDEWTGEIVQLPLQVGVHVLIAGITGMGKSVSWRPLFMRAVASPDWTPIVVDPKRQEAIGVQHAVRAVGQEPNREKRMADIYALVKELTREMYRRQGVAKSSTWEPDGRPENRFLLVIIDEGAAIVRMSRQPKYADVLDMLEELWSEARAAGFQFVWATQNPTKTGGVPALVKDNMPVRMSLTTGAGEHERSIFDENAQQEGWTPSKLDGIPGRAMLKHGRRRPNPIRLWHVEDKTLLALPEADPWTSPAAPAAEQLKVVAGGAEAAEQQAETGPAANKRKVLEALEAIEGGPISQADLQAATGISKSTLSRTVISMVNAGQIARDANGALVIPTDDEDAALDA
jgi:S-DNA-T family DNA segregation ATPase FtsK/SpoIIIE